jgi:hypothetical protein
MQNIFVEFLPPWVETGLQPAFYDKESGTVLQQVARMYAKVNYLIKMFNDFSKDTTDFVNDFVDSTNTEISRFETEVDTRVTNFEQSTTETVNDYIARFVALKDFVDDYFDNLDVQEEINNKLDQMAEDGILQEIITTYIQSNVAWTFDNVAEMKLATNFVNGSYAKTLGFYTRTDKGGAIYKIRTKTGADTANEMTLIDLSDNTLIAELVISNEMNVKQFGAKGDGSTDDTSSIQTAITVSEILNVPSGTYMVNSVTHISIPSDRILRLSEDAVIKSITNDQDGYAILYLNDVDNVEISGGTIQGDRDTHTGATGQWGHCISIYSSSNINIHDINLIDSWGDGLYINDVTNIVTNNIVVDKARRNGISVISVNGYRGNNTIIKNISGTAPESGIDFEPNSITDVFKNIILTNFSTSNTAFGICFALNNLDSTSAPIDAMFNNFCDHNSTDGMRLTKNANVTGTIVFNGVRLYDNPVNPIALRNFAYGSSFSLQCNDIYIKRSTADGTNQEYAAIRAYGNQTNGNIHLKNIEIYQTGVDTNVPDIFIRDANDISIINPIHRTNSVTITNDQNFKMYDPLYTYVTRSGSGGGYAGATDMRSLSIKDNTGYSSTTVEFTAQAPVGYQCTFVNINTSQTYGVKLPADTYCRAFSSSAAPTITLAPGATLTLRKIDTYEIVPISQSGTITAS